ncbi:S-adenosyl-L-methionine-dependent methyltransferase [Xylaria telfairii]|nr:S-adenosyl-L-methionine-dependent methyltransferase [Xylaria telfairii]
MEHETATRDDGSNDFERSYSEIARSGFTVPALYDKYRPGYPDEVVDYLIHNLKIPSNASILEIGAGTGKLTEVLSSRLPASCITAMEPHPTMRAFLEQKRLKNVTVMDGLAQSIPLPDDVVDCILIAQAFHWFANIESLKEMNRVLKSAGGGLGLIWNMEDYNSPRSLPVQTEWESQLRELIWSLDDYQPRFKSKVWHKPFFDPAAKDLFTLPLNADTWRVERQIPVAELEGRILTYCMLQNADAEDARLHRRRILEILEAGSLLNGELVMRSSVVAVWTNKKVHVELSADSPVN